MGAAPAARFRMRNLAVLRARGVEHSRPARVSFAADGDAVLASAVDDVCTVTTGLEAEMRVAAVALAVDADVPLDMELLSVQQMPSGSEYVAIGRRGEIVRTAAGAASLVGRIADGIRAACWSPALDVLALVTGQAQLLLLSADFEVLFEGPVEADAADGQFVSVGWGRKETQFHGAAGKQAAQSAAAVLMRPAAGDDGLPRIAFRGDGQLLAVSQVDAASSARRIRVFTRAGALEAVSEPVGVLEAALAWMPSGALLAATAMHPDGRRQVVFFERNGLRHGELSLRRSTGVASLAWNADSSLLAVRFLDGAVEVWTSRNYHWYLKLQLPQPAADFAWNPVRPRCCVAVTLDHRVLALHLGWAVCRSQCDEGDRLSVCAVVDGCDILLTPLAVAMVPPPLSTARCAVAATPSAVALFVRRDRVLLLYAHARTATLLDASFGGEPQVLLDLRFEQLVTAVALTEDGVLVQCADGAVAVYSHAGAALATVAGPADSVLSRCGAYVQTYGGAVWRLRPWEPALVSPRGFCPALLAYESAADGPVLLLLSEEGHLSVNGQELLAGCACLYQTPDFVVVVQAAEKSLRFLPKAAPVALWPAVLRGATEESSRRIEAGSEVVCSSVPGAFLLLQAPRGNLEAVCPRALVLASVRRSLASLDYARAYFDCRRHRIDLNILVDAAPQTFLRTADMLVEQLGAGDLLNLFVAGLRAESTAQTKYLGFAAHAAEPLEDKVNTVCARVREVIAARPDAARHVETVMTTYVCQQPPQLEAALQAITAQAAAGVDAATLERSLAYLIFLVDAARLYDVALGLYNLPLALSIARRSQQNPDEYVPFLEGLAALPSPSLCRFRIDAHLQRHARALAHYHEALGSPEAGLTFDGFLEYMGQHGLFTAAAELVQADPERSRRVLALFGAHLAAAGDAVAAAAVYSLAGDLPAALEACVGAGLWRQALAAAAGLPAADRRLLVADLHGTLMGQSRFAEAHTLALAHMGAADGAEAALAAALAGGLWLEAAALPVDVAAEVVPAAARAAAEILAEVGEAQAAFEEKAARLLLIQRHLLDPPAPQPAAAAGANILDNLSEMSFRSGAASTVITRSSAYSGTTTHRSKKRAEKALRKAKPGSVFEREGLRLHIDEHIARAQAYHGSVGGLLQVLSLNGQLGLARSLQAALLALTRQIALFSARFRESQQQLQARPAAPPGPGEPPSVAEEIEARHAWHRAFELPASFTAPAWTLAYL